MSSDLTENERVDTADGLPAAAPGSDGLPVEPDLLDDGPAPIELEWPPPGYGERGQAARRKRGLVEWLLVLGATLTLFVVVRMVVIQAYWIPSGSMENTLLVGDRVMVNKLSYKLHDVHRGDVVVFERPEGVRKDEIKDLIKRVVALPGENVQAKDGQLYIDGHLLSEPYLKEPASVADFGPVLVPTGSVFVMGDNRRNSSDSRVFGPIKQSSIVGRAFVRFWPVTRFGSL
jgi:signal peptidase I